MKKHLTTLSILHYVYGALVCVVGLSLLVFVALGSFLSSDWLLEQAQGDVPPAWLGGFFQALGWSLFAFLEIKGVLNIISGALIARQRGRTFSLVVGGLDCLNIPFGLGLAIFTFITLSDDEVRRAYGAVAP